MGRGNESLIVKSGSHDQDGRNAHRVRVKTTQKSSSPEPWVEERKFDSEIRVT